MCSLRTRGRQFDLALYTKRRICTTRISGGVTIRRWTSAPRVPQFSQRQSAMLPTPRISGPRMSSIKGAASSKGTPSEELASVAVELWRQFGHLVVLDCVKTRRASMTAASLRLQLAHQESDYGTRFTNTVSCSWSVATSWM